MAKQHARILATFTATVQRSKNRLVATPAEVQRRLDLTKRRDNRIVAYSVRLAGSGRWNHHFGQLTHDSEFSIPSDVTHIRPGSRVEIKLHRLIPNADVLPETPNPAI